MAKLPTIKENEDALQMSKGERANVYDLLPQYVQEAIDTIPEDYRLLEERELRKTLKPNASVQALRNSFWVEYARCIDNRSKLSISKIISGICNIEYFSQVVLKHPMMVEWMMRPPVSYNRAMEESLHFGVERLREILELPISYTKVDSNGFERVIIDHKAADLILKAFTIVDTRVKGSVVQRQQNLNVSGTMSELKTVMESASMDDIKRKVWELKRREAEAGGVVVEVESEEVSS